MPLSLTLNREGATVPPDAAASRHDAVHRARRAPHPSPDGPRRLRQGGGHLADPQGVRRTGGREHVEVHSLITGLESERSEEHTSELQSLAYLVCRLLLEKKKKKERVHLIASTRM